MLMDTKKSQSQKFKDAARATGCDEDEAAFEARLKKIVKPVPPQAQKPKSAPKKRRSIKGDSK